MTSRQLSYLLLLLGLFAFVFADISISTYDPWAEFSRFAVGLLSPDFYDVELLLQALLTTVAFAILGVTLGSSVGMLLALLFHYRLVRSICAFVRAIHELFWALIFLQVFGLHPLTGLLAIALPYAATFAKVYAEILEEADKAPLASLAQNAGRISVFVYGRLAVAWDAIKTYTSYRLECALRSSAVLGFIGLPTLGYYLESAFLQGEYSHVSALLLSFYVLIASIPFWLNRSLLPVYIITAAIYLFSSAGTITWSNLQRFFTQDIVPYPLRNGGDVTELYAWLENLLVNQAFPGIVETLVLTQVVLLATGVLALLVFPLVSTQFFSRPVNFGGRLFLIVMRSTPEYILAFIFLQLWGPSMLPAIMALTLHNGGIIAHLIGRNSSTLVLPTNASFGFSRYAYEIVPRVYRQFMAFLLYRWEIIMRETAILGILGIATLGFYVDSAMQELRFDRAMVLILITAFLNISIDALSRWLRRRSQIKFLGQRCQ